MKSYVLGFAFSAGKRMVLMIEKKRPEWQAGCYNGIGGHIEPNELPIDAMVREFGEETGIETCRGHWKEFMYMQGFDKETKMQTWECFCFKSFGIDVTKAQDMTDERIKIIPLKNLSLHKIISNIPWIIFLALDEDAPLTVRATYETKVLSARSTR